MRFTHLALAGAFLHADMGWNGEKNMGGWGTMQKGAMPLSPSWLVRSPPTYLPAPPPTCWNIASMSASATPR